MFLIYIFCFLIIFLFEYTRTIRSPLIDLVSSPYSMSASSRPILEASTSFLTSSIPSHTLSSERSFPNRIFFEHYAHRRILTAPKACLAHCNLLLFIVSILFSLTRQCFCPIIFHYSPFSVSTTGTKIVRSIFLSNTTSYLS